MTSPVLAAALVSAAVLSLALAAVVIAVAPRRRANQLLFLILFLSGTATVLWEGWNPVWAQPSVFAYNALSTAALLVVYLALLAETLDTPLVAPFRRRSVLVAVAGLAALTLVEFLPTLARVADAGPPYDADAVYDSIAPTLALTLGVLVFALAASLSAWRRAAPGSVARTRARHFTLAFGARDLCIILAIGLPTGPGLDSEAVQLLWPLALILSVPLLAYGILKAQLFDIDLRIKQGVRRGVVLAAFLVAFGAVAVVVERATTTALGLAAGGTGVALLLFALVPLQRVADRVADHLLPGVRADEDYLGRRKLEVYRGALEDALLRSPASAASDPVLADLRRALAITAEQHRILLVALLPRAGPPGAPPEQFEVRSELGRGGHGRALLARDRLLDRMVVLKEPLVPLPPGSAARERFLREARIAAQLHHPNVVAVHQVIADRDPPLIVLEHVDGESLADRLAREGPLPPAEVARIGLDVLAGLHRIHRAGIIHRDLKPANILLARDGVAKITDFGVAHAPSDASAAPALTSPGVHPGSPAYMSPEQARGQPLGPRSDLYSLGVVLHEALTGSPPPTSADATLPQLAFPRPAGPLPPALGLVLRRALEADPERRFADAQAMAASLRAAAAVPA